MITESTPATVAVPPDVSEQISRIRTDLDELQRELDQALEVWRATLETEKTQFEDLWRHKDLAWQEQQAEWQRQREAYEQRIETLQAEYETRLKQTEQNAIRTLNELDDAWQRDKLDWGPPARAEWATLRPALETRIQELEKQLEEAGRAREALQDENESRLRQASEAAATEARAPIESLQSQLADFESRMNSMQNLPADPDALVEASLRTLDCQIQVLYDFIRLAAGEISEREISGNAPASLDNR